MSQNVVVDPDAAKPAEIEHPVLIIRINRLYRYGMSDVALYEATRGIWKLGKRRENAEYAFATYKGVILEVYEIHQWYPAGTLPYQTRDLSQRRDTGRWEFEGEIAPERIRDQYRHKSVRRYLKPGNRHPVLYVNVSERG